MESLRRRIRWFRDDLDRLRREPQWAWQRVRRGYSDRDLWSLDYTLAEILTAALPFYRSHPKCSFALGDECTPQEEWDGVIDEMVRGFARYDDKRDNDLSFEEERDLRQRAWDLLAERHSAFWW